MSEWIKWNGGKCPVPNDTVVEVIQRNGDEFAGYEADCFEWGHDPVHYDYRDIIAYRVVE